MNNHYPAMRRARGFAALLLGLVLALTGPAFAAEGRRPLDGLRAVRSQQVGFLHHDLFMRADMAWPDRVYVDGEFADVRDSLRQALAEGEPAAIEGRLRAALSFDRVNSRHWTELAVMLNRYTASARGIDATALLGYRELAVSVALNAWLTADEPGERAPALDVLAEALALIGDRGDAARVGRLRLSMAPAPGLEASVETWESDIDHLGAPQPHRHPQVRPVEKVFGQWIVTCDNGASCSATNVTGANDFNGARIDITRDGGPFAAPHIEFRVSGNSVPGDGTYKSWNPDSGMETVIIGKTRLAETLLHGTSWERQQDDGPYRLAVPLAATRAMLDAMMSQPMVAFGPGHPINTVTTDGAAAALAFMDRFQGRTGSRTATGKPGTGSDLAVPLAGKLPLDPAPAVAGTELPGQPPKAVLAAFAKACDEGAPADLHASGYRIRSGQDLWFLHCFVGPYNSGYMVFAAEGGGVRKLTFADLDWSGGDPAPSDMVWNYAVVRDIDFVSYVDGAGKSGPRPFMVVSTNLGRGLGDCGNTNEYLFDGTGFRLHSRAQMGCLGWNTNWAYIWRGARFAAEPATEPAKDEPTAPISHAFYTPAYRACVHSADTHAQVACADAETARWDARLNAAYRKLMAGNLSASVREDLQAGQRAWLRERDAFCPLPYALMQQGSMGVAASAFCKTRFTAQRAELLEEAAGIFTEAGPGPEDYRLDQQRHGADYSHCAGDQAGEPGAIDCEMREQQRLGAAIRRIGAEIAGKLDPASRPGFTAYGAAADTDIDRTCRALGAIAGADPVHAAHCRTRIMALRHSLLLTWSDEGAPAD